MSLNNLNRGKIKIVIIVVAVLVLMVIGYFGIKSFPPSMQPQDLIKNSNNEQENTKPVYVAEIPKPIRESTISQVIEAEKGGQIELIDEKGTTISLFVFPGSLKKDTTVSLSLLEKVPITDYVSNMHNGVLIEPESLKFEQPAYLTFDFNPVKILDNPFGFYNKTNILASIVSSVSAASSSEELLPSELLEQGFGVVVVHSNSQSGTVRTEPSASSLDDNSEVNTPVFEGGSYTPDSPNSDKAEDLNNQAAANSNSGSAGLGGPEAVPQKE